jgi:hypothetical protein
MQAMVAMRAALGSIRDADDPVPMCLQAQTHRSERLTRTS